LHPCIKMIVIYHLIKLRSIQSTSKPLCSTKLYDTENKMKNASPDNNEKKDSAPADSWEAAQSTLEDKEGNTSLEKRHEWLEDGPFLDDSRESACHHAVGVGCQVKPLHQYNQRSSTLAGSFDASRLTEFHFAIAPPQWTDCEYNMLR
jgi:hypothetical protein